MKKLTILALHLGYGGIEKCISNLVNSLTNDYNIEIVSTYKLSEKPAFNIDEKVQIKYLTNLKPNQKEIKYYLKKFKYIKLIKELIKMKKILSLSKKLMIDYIKQSDSNIIISTKDIYNLWLGKYGRKNTLKIGWEQKYHQNNSKYINKIIESVSNLDYFVLASQHLKQFYENKVNCKCVHIPNSINYIPSKKSDLSEDRIISVGRLSKEKGFLELIDVFNIVHQTLPNVKLDIIGDGEEKEKIIEKIHKYNLESNVIIHGYQSPEYIEEKMLKSSVYVMPSILASFGPILIESSSFGLPCIAFETSGTKDQIQDNWDGYLIKNYDKEKMAKRIINLMKDKNRRIIMGDNAYKKSFKYLSSNIKDEWINLFENR